MSSLWSFLITTVLVVIFIVVGGYMTQAADYLRGYRKQDPLIDKAYRYCVYVAIIVWSIVALVIIIISLAVTGIVALFSTGVGEVGVAAEAGEGATVEEGASRNFTGNNPNLGSGISWITFGFLILAMILVTIAGVLAAQAAAALKSSPKYNPDNRYKVKAYDNCRTSAILSLGAVGLLLLSVTFYLLYEYRQRELAKEQRLKVQTAEVDAIKTREATLAAARA